MEPKPPGLVLLVMTAGMFLILLDSSKSGFNVNQSAVRPR